MKKLLLCLSLISLSIIGLAQNTSPLIVRDFMLQTNGIMDVEQVPRDARTDWDSNPVCMIQVKAVGFDENLMQKFIFVPNGMDIMYKTIKNGMVILYVSSNKMGEITIKHMGDCLFRLPYKLEGHKIYTLTLGMESATLVIRSIPTEAEIYIDNEKVGTGYASKAVSIGVEHRYKVECTDYWPKEGMVYFDKRDEKLINIELEANFGYITIKTEPAGANVLVDGRKVGDTPYILEKIAFGQHRVELQKPGYEKYVKVVVIKADELENTQLDNVTLKKDPNYNEQQVAATPVTPIQGFQIAQETISSINGVFSVSPTKKVSFSKGNLQYQASTNTWRFAEHQWDYVGATEVPYGRPGGNVLGSSNHLISPKYDGWIDLFGWGTGTKPTKISGHPTSYRGFGDWGNNTISNGGGKKWFTLTKDEWVYVFDRRNTSSGIRYAKAIVNGVNGVILLPDNWSGSYYSLNDTNKSDVSFGSNSISKNDWTSSFETYGAVFLPATGLRYGTNVIYVGVHGYYWSATDSGSSDAYYAPFDPSHLYADQLRNRFYGLGVRLVCPAE